MWVPLRFLDSMRPAKHRLMEAAATIARDGLAKSNYWPCMQCDETGCMTGVVKRVV